MFSYRIIVLAVVLNIVEFDSDNTCGAMLRKHILGFLVILCVSVVIEMFGAWMSMRGTILNTEPRSGMHYVLYIRLGRQQLFRLFHLLAFPIWLRNIWKIFLTHNVCKFYDGKLQFVDAVSYIV